MDKFCKRFLSGFCWRSKHTYKHTNMNTSRVTQRPGTTVEPQLPIRGHYCQTLERKLPGAHWLPTYRLLQFNYKFDKMKHCTHSMWQYSTSDNKHQEQLADKSSERPISFIFLHHGWYLPPHSYLWSVTVKMTEQFVFSETQTDKTCKTLLKSFSLIGCCCHNKLDQGQVFYYSSVQDIAKLIKSKI